MSAKCHGCFKEVSSENLYCNRCQKRLFGGKKVQPLSFDKTEFYKKRKELAPKMSISGVQDKISLVFNSDNILEATETNGHYILKPIPAAEELDNKDDICVNEHLSMQISEQIFKIETAPSGLIPFSNGELAYITRRFDYAKDDTKLDQEDFASILNHTEEEQGKNYKYESSYEACAEAIQKFVPASIPTLEEFYRRILLNYLIGNADAHLKNFSLYRKEGRSDWSLTPNYDLLYTRYHIPNELGYMGLELFDDYETTTFLAVGHYALEDFETFATILGIKPKRLTKIFEQILSSTPALLEMVDNSFLSEEGKRAYKKNYMERLKLHLCYRVERYPFKSQVQPVIDKYMPMIDKLYTESLEY